MRTIQIKDIGDVITGHTPPTSKKEYYGDYALFIKPTDISVTSKYTYATEEGYSELAYKKYKSSMIPKGSTCVVCIETLGEKMTMAHCDCFTNQSMNSIVPNDSFDQQYVYYLLKNSLYKVKNLNKGTASGREFVSKSTFLDMEIDVHEDINTQRRIGQILCAYDDLIENNQKKIQLLEEAAERIYREWYIDFRFPGHEKVDVISDVPKGWHRSSVGEICSLKKEIIHPAETEEGTPYIGLEHIPRHDFCLSDWGNASEVSSNKYKYNNEDIIFGQIRPYFHKVGFAINDGVASTDSFIMRAKEGLWGLLLLTVSSDRFVNYAYQTCKEGAKMPRADWNQMKEYSVLIADETVQSAFEKMIADITKEIKCLAIQNHDLVESRDRLLAKLMSGEIEL